MHVRRPVVLRLANERIEDAIYESQSIRRFGGIDLTHEFGADVATLLSSADC